MLTWKIEQIDCMLAESGPRVFNIYWRVNGVDGEHAVTTCGTQTITDPLAASFVPYEELTEQQVLDWVKADLGETKVQGIEAGVALDLDRMKNSPIVIMPLPW